MPYMTVRLPRASTVTYRHINQPPPPPVSDAVQVYVSPGEHLSSAQLMQRARDTMRDIERGRPPPPVAVQPVQDEWPAPNWPTAFTWFVDNEVASVPPVALPPQMDWFMQDDEDFRRRVLESLRIGAGEYAAPMRAPVQCDYEPDVLPLPG